MNPRMMLILTVSLESPLNIDTKHNPAFGFCDVIMTCALTKIKKFGFLLYKSIGKIGFWLKFLPKTQFDLDFLLIYEREWLIIPKYEI